MIDIYLWLVYIILILGFGAITVILFYHWRCFAMNKRVVALVETTYLTVLIPLALIALLALVMISLN